jgi:hypothetical protein
MSSRYGCVVTEPRARIDELPVLPQHAERHESRDYKLLTHFCLPGRHDHRSGLFAEYIARGFLGFSDIQTSDVFFGRREVRTHKSTAPST